MRRPSRRILSSASRATPQLRALAEGLKASTQPDASAKPTHPLVGIASDASASGAGGRPKGLNPAGCVGQADVSLSSASRATPRLRALAQGVDRRASPTLL